MPQVTIKISAENKIFDIETILMDNSYFPGLQHREIRVSGYQPLAAGAFEVHLQTRVRAAAFGADYDAIAEAGVVDALA